MVSPVKDQNTRNLHLKFLNLCKYLKDVKLNKSGLVLEIPVVFVPRFIARIQE